MPDPQTTSRHRRGVKHKSRLPCRQKERRPTLPNRAEMRAIRGEEVINQERWYPRDPPDGLRALSAALGNAQIKEITDLRSQIKLGRFFGIEIGLHYSGF